MPVSISYLERIYLLKSFYQEATTSSALSCGSLIKNRRLNSISHQLKTLPTNDERSSKFYIVNDEY